MRPNSQQIYELCFFPHSLTAVQLGRNEEHDTQATMYNGLYPSSACSIKYQWNQVFHYLLECVCIFSLFKHSFSSLFLNQWLINWHSWQGWGQDLLHYWKERGNLKGTKSVSIYTKWTLLWLQDEEQKKRYLCFKSIILIELVIIIGSCYSDWGCTRYCNCR